MISTEGKRNMWQESYWIDMYIWSLKSIFKEFLCLEYFFKLRNSHALLVLAKNKYCIRKKSQIIHFMVSNAFLWIEMGFLGVFFWWKSYDFITKALEMYTAARTSDFFLGGKKRTIHHENNQKNRLIMFIQNYVK